MEKGKVYDSDLQENKITIVIAAFTPKNGQFMS